MEKHNPLDRFLSKVIPVTESGCMLWDATPGSVYGLFWLYGRNEHAHRASWMLHNGTIPDGKWVLHKCDVKGCVNPDHLYLGSHADNTKDAVYRNRMAKGDKHGMRQHLAALRFTDNPNGRLSKTACLEIHQKSKSVSKAALAQEYRIHISTVYRAIARADALLAELENTGGES